MHIVFAAAEAAPYAKVGGLADVAGSLPQALAALGHEITLYLPLHETIDRAKFGIPASGPTRSVPYGRSKVKVAYPSIERDGVRVVFVDNAKRIGRDRVYGAKDDNKRYAFFCRAVFEDVQETMPDVVHAHDWHAALLVPLVARARSLARTATVFTIHTWRTRDAPRRTCSRSSDCLALACRSRIAASATRWRERSRRRTS